jgi:flavin-dependent dehydrogenase
MEPIRIAGAGPSGLMAAITLARAGRSVVVSDKRPHPGGRFRGDLQGLENWSSRHQVMDELISMGLEPGFDATAFERVVVSDTRRVRSFRVGAPSFYLVRRGPVEGSLDRAMASQAQAMGVSLRWGHELEPERADILATGPRTDHVTGVVRGYTFTTDAPDQAVMVYHDELAWKGYAYQLVAGGQGCRCTLVNGELGRIRACYRRAMAHLEERFPLEIRDRRAMVGVGNYHLRKTLRRGRALVVGEAAGLQDFMWGFGLRFALISGHLAARALLEGSDYEALVGERLLPLAKAGVVNRYLWDRLIRGEDYGRLVTHLGAIELVFPALHRFGAVQRALYPRAERHVIDGYPQVVGRPGPG